MKNKRSFENDEREAFLRFCEFVNSMEGDKDAFLKAARLQRIERQPMDKEMFGWLLWLIGIMTVVISVALVTIINIIA